MCRLFGFRSVIQSQVHRSLVSAENALGVQSALHRDGWGVAYYAGGVPHLLRSADTALSDKLFHRVSGIVASETVVAHIRSATQGLNTPVNNHPFQHGRWVFAHNGNVAGFREVRAELLEDIAPEFLRFLLGDTDSEVLFYLLLSCMQQRAAVHHVRPYPLDAVLEAMEDVVERVVRAAGPCSTDPAGPPEDTYLTWVLTDGSLLVGHHGGKPLHFSTWKTRCPEREVCPFFQQSCEALSASGRVNHLIVSSEPLQGENVWWPMRPGQFVAVDGAMRLSHRGAGHPVI
jgi:glutamine amidotransferase